jgi:ABC-type sugar transport system permease subunit
LRQLNGRNLDFFQTIGLPTLIAFEMHVLVVVFALIAVVFAKCVLRIAGVVQNFVNDAFGQKSSQSTIDGYSVKGFADFFFNVGIGQGKRLVEKYIQDFGTAVGIAKFVGLKNFERVFGSHRYPNMVVWVLFFI